MIFLSALHEANIFSICRQDQSAVIIKFSIKMKVFPSTRCYDETIFITAINFSIEYG